MPIYARSETAPPPFDTAPSPAELHGMALAVLASSPDCIKILSADGRIEYLSEGGRAALELECGDATLIGRDWLPIWGADAQPRVAAALASARQGEQARFEAFCPTLKGTPRWWDVAVSPLGSDRSGPGKLLAISRDITASRNTAAALVARVDRQEMLYRLASQLLKAQDEAALLRIVTSVAPRDLGIDLCMAYEADCAARILSIRHAHGLSAARQRDLVALPFGQMLCGQVAETQRPVIKSRIGESTDPICSVAVQLGLEAFAGFPLLSEAGELFGVLSFASRGRLEFGAQDLSLLRAIAEMYAAVARRLRVSQALDESKGNLRLLLDGARDHAIFKLDRDGRIASWSEAAERLYGYPAEAAIGRPFGDLYPAEDRASGVPEAALAQALRDGKTSCAGWRLRADGTRFAVAGTIATLYGPAGAVVGFAKVTEDISARLVQENALKSSESRHRAVVETAVDAIVVIDVHGTIQAFNRAAERMFGYSAEMAMGRAVDMLMSEEVAAHHDRAMRRYLETGVARVIGVGREVVGRRRDGTDFPLELALAEWWDAAGERFFTGIMRDVSEKRAAEAARREAHEAVLRASRLTALGAMASTIAHELNQPLTAMANYMSATRFALSDGTPGTDGAMDTLDRALLALRRVNEIISRMRSFAKNGQIQARPVALAPIIDEAWEKVRHCCPAAGVRYRCQGLRRHLLVRADRTQIEQVMINLMRNAVEAMDGRSDRSLTVRVSVAEGQAVIALADTGPGLPPERLADPAQIFASSKPEGTGLGLPVCATIIEAHGGRLSAAATPGGGATFIVTLPLVPESGPGAPAAMV